MDPVRNVADDGLTSASPAVALPPPTPFGKPMRALFDFAPNFCQLNHGSYGSFPTAVRLAREKYLRDHEAAVDVYRRFVEPKLLVRSRAALAPLLGPDVHVNEVALVTNATTGVNVVVANLANGWSADGGDAVLYFGTIYDACRKTMLAHEEAGRLRTVEIPVHFTRDSSDVIVARLHTAHADAVARGLRPRLLVIDTIVSAPGVLLPWERLTAAARDLGMLSLIDGAHGIGHIDLTHLGGTVKPDFFTSNCHKWLFAPRGCAVLYVPLRNQHLFATSLPTSHGYLRPENRPAPGSTASDNYFSRLFADVGTADHSPYLCIPDAIAFREKVCGGEKAIHDYCVDLARKGGDAVAAILGTDVMDAEGNNVRDCALVNVRLPITVKPDSDISSADSVSIPLSRLPELLTWLSDRMVAENNIFIPVNYYDGQLWVRLSAQVYLELDDFKWGANLLLDLCDRVKKCEWKA